MLRLQPPEPRELARPFQLRLRRLRQSQVVARVPRPGRGQLAVLLEPLQGVLPDGLEETISGDTAVSIATEAMMDVSRVGDAVVQMASLPLDTNILFMTIMATKMPFVGRG